MNARNLKKSSRTDWARIDRMTDEEIDFSDSPPLDDAFFARAKWRLPRLYIDLNDFKQARQFADYIVTRKLHQKKTPLKQLQHLAFNTSLVISYSRPFHGNRDFERKPKSSLKKEVREVLTADEVRLHDRILILRDQAYAHSDANSHLFEGLDYTKSAGFFQCVDILDETEIRKLKNMIRRWVTHLESKKSDLKNSLRRTA